MSAVKQAELAMQVARHVAAHAMCSGGKRLLVAAAAGLPGASKFS